LAFKNHALDDFLKQLIKVGIDMKDRVRLGGSFSAEMQGISIESLKRASPDSHKSWSKVYHRRRQLEDASEEFERIAQNFFNTKTNLAKVLEWLEFSNEYSDFFHAFAVPEVTNGANSAAFSIRGRKKDHMKPNYLIQRWIDGRDPGALATEVQRHRAWSMMPADRRKLFSTW